jgi:hypothetical protein
VAYPVETLRQVGPVNDVVAGVEIAVLTDIESGTVFDPASGRSLEGPLLGQNLDPLPGVTAFPWEFPQLWPHGVMWAPSSG